MIYKTVFLIIIYLYYILTSLTLLLIVSILEQVLIRDPWTKTKPASEVKRKHFKPIISRLLKLYCVVKLRINTVILISAFSN